MQQTPMHDLPNLDLLALVPQGVERVVEAGCSSGALGQAFLAQRPEVEYIGIEMVREYAEVARGRLSEVVVANVEEMEDRSFDVLNPTDCWIFGDVLEHLYDPWRTLKRVRRSLGEGGCVVACIPNAQHWSVQGLLNIGEFRYQDAGLLDRTHIRWFTRKTIIELFASTGFDIEEMGGRVFEEPGRAQALPAIRSLAQACGSDPDEAERDALPIQYLVRARARAA
ncbi:MAG TPA: methyltransferase domain-containing protein [Usitatibacter sp.]|jgi:SAM-dependent methyltransferase|nr:methyltransferase domain-containing protein [Usitatibacter sp.]